MGKVLSTLIFAASLITINYGRRPRERRISHFRPRRTTARIPLMQQPATELQNTQSRSVQTTPAQAEGELMFYIVPPFGHGSVAIYVPPDASVQDAITAAVVQQGFPSVTRLQFGGAELAPSQLLSDAGVTAEATLQSVAGFPHLTEEELSSARLVPAVEWQQQIGKTVMCADTVISGTIELEDEYRPHSPDSFRVVWTIDKEIQGKQIVHKVESTQIVSRTRILSLYRTGETLVIKNVRMCDRNLFKPWESNELSLLHGDKPGTFSAEDKIVLKGGVVILIDDDLLKFDDGTDIQQDHEYTGQIIEQISVRNLEYYITPPGSIWSSRTDDLAICVPSLNGIYYKVKLENKEDPVGVPESSMSLRS